MHSSFSNFYRIAAIEINAAELEKKWAAVESAVPKVSTSTICGIASFVITGKKDEAAMSEYLGLLSSADPTIISSNNDIELRALAAGLIAELIGYEDSDASAAALAILTAVFSGRRQDVLFPELVEIAQVGLRRRSLQIRQESLDQFQEKCEELNTLCLKVDSQLKGVSDFSGIGATVSPLFLEFNKTFSSSLHAHQMLAEEANILWWLTNASSQDFGAKLASYSPEVRALIVGKELADLITLAPGPASASAILVRALNEDGDGPTMGKLEVGISDVPEVWRRTFVDDEMSPIVDRYRTLFPISYSTRKALEVPDPRSWVTFVGQSLGIDIEMEFPIAAIALQAFRERQLLKLLLEE